MELLSDLHGIFKDAGQAQALATEVIIGRLTALEDRPWATFTRGDKITGHRLARLLKQFDVKRPEKIRINKDEVIRGYRREWFEDAFARYLPSKAEQAEQPNSDGPKPAKSKVEQDGAVPLCESEGSTNNDGPCSTCSTLTPEQPGHAGETNDAGTF